MKEGSIDEKYFNVSLFFFIYQLTHNIIREWKFFNRSFLQNKVFLHHIFIIADDQWSLIIKVEQIAMEYFGFNLETQFIQLRKRNLNAVQDLWISTKPN